MLSPPLRFERSLYKSAVRSERRSPHFPPSVARVVPALTLLSGSSPPVNTRRAGRIRDSYANPRRSRGFATLENSPNPPSV